MKRFMILVNLFFATPQSLRFLLSTQLLDFVVVFSRRRTIAKALRLCKSSDVNSFSAADAMEKYAGVASLAAGRGHPKTR